MASASTTIPSVPLADQRGWLRRNWKWFIPGMLFVALVLGAIAVFSYVQIRSYKYRANPAYHASLAEVQQNKQIQERLGAPIVDSDWNPQGRIEITDNLGDAAFNFTVSGPEGIADVATEGRMVSGEWAVTRLVVRFPDGERINLSEEIAAKQQVDTPAFDPRAKKQTQDKSDEPPKEVTVPELNVDVPDAPPDVK
jgi:hypothetical protein